MYENVNFHVISFTRHIPQHIIKPLLLRPKCVCAGHSGSSLKTVIYVLATTAQLNRRPRGIRRFAPKDKTSSTVGIPLVNSDDCTRYGQRTVVRVRLGSATVECRLRFGFFFQICRLYKTYQNPSRLFNYPFSTLMFAR